MVNMDRPFESRLHIESSTNNHHSQLRSTTYPDCCFMAILSSRIMRKLWSNTRERTQSEGKEQAEDSSYTKGIEVILKETAREELSRERRKSDARTSRLLRSSIWTSLRASKQDLWIRPTDLFWHSPTLVTIRELLFKKYCGRSIANLEARDESKKQKTQKNKKSDQPYRDTTWHIFLANEVLYIEPLIHGDENNVCL